jgi:hypothetical protein
LILNLSSDLAIVTTHMSGSVPLATIAGTRPNQRLLVAIAQGDDGRTTIELREQHYGEGVGWFDQRTVTLDPREWQQLQTILGAAPESASIAAEAARVPAVIPFRTMTDPPRRSVAGGRG